MGLHAHTPTFKSSASRQKNADATVRGHVIIVIPISHRKLRFKYSTDIGAEVTEFLLYFELKA